VTAFNAQSSREGLELLRVEGLVTGYSQPVVGPLSFAVESGEVVGLWGANGTGKSTVLNAIGRGARVFDGFVARAPGLTLAYQEQQPVRLPVMPLTGGDIMRAAGAEHREAPPTLAAILDRRIDALSGGQYQLLCVWAALGSATDLVLLDEPTNNLDPPTEALLIDILAAKRGRRAVLLVSHERRFLDAVCSQVLSVATWNGGN
jgi:zinc transport system ATP-binding protein